MNDELDACRALMRKQAMWGLTARDQMITELLDAVTKLEARLRVLEALEKAGNGKSNGGRRVVAAKPRGR